MRWAFVLIALVGCGSLEKSANEDPMKCERDPKCQKKQLKVSDCSTQCSDDPACVQRCEEFRQGAGSNGLGH